MLYGVCVLLSKSQIRNSLSIQSQYNFSTQKNNPTPPALASTIKNLVIPALNSSSPLFSPSSPTSTLRTFHPITPTVKPPDIVTHSQSRSQQQQLLLHVPEPYP
jgi:hypothetical protein